ncbi:response regulator [Exilibacterium tricleocarpae]|uniref:Response regulator n=1 Tax=Exilibacterium tricleocarpae TaxID=2591008 RepID=A0A545T637_9GAMM|nr:response regulator [Exilibacterium tricleocarpae]TQV72683.1 response regulator [Exilibacterium tricleocarpae]
MHHPILIVEDEPKIAALLGDYLHNAGFETTHLDRGDQVEDWLAQHTPALILLDIMLPGKDGLELCKSIRRRRDTPIIMVTARVEEIDRLLGLELGADDYICKPFSPREVVARVKTVLRRLQPGTAPADDLSLDEAGYRATIKGRQLDLTAVEFKLLKMLADQPGRIFSRSQLMDTMYTDHRIVSDRTVDSHIKKLRKKIAERVPERELIHSVYGVGYKYEALVED